MKLDTSSQQIDIHASHPRGTKFCCPQCAQSLPCDDHVPERQWPHLDSCQYKTVLHVSVPRVKCPKHGVKQAKVPWAEKSSRFTLLFERFAIDLLLVTQTVKGAMEILANPTTRQKRNLFRACLLANVVSYCTYKITNADAEGMNSKIMTIKRRVGGYRNPENSKIAIYFYCGRLDLYPQ